MLSPGLPTAKTLLAVRDGACLSKKQGRYGPVWHTIVHHFQKFQGRVDPVAILQ